MSHFPHFHGYYHRPSRLLWFIVGAGTTAYWMSYHRHSTSFVAPPRSQNGALEPPNSWKNWEKERVHMQETLGELSEAALDAVVLRAQAMKQRLAERRAADQGGHPQATETHPSGGGATTK